MELSEKFKEAKRKSLYQGIKIFFGFKGVMEFWNSYKESYIQELDDIVQSFEFKFDNKDIDGSTK